MKLTESILNYIIKKGMLYEARNVDVDFDIPTTTNAGSIKINLKAENMTIKVDKE